MALTCCLPSYKPPRWPSGKASDLRAADLGQTRALPMDLFSRSNPTNELKLVLQWLPSQPLDVVGSVLGLFGLGQYTVTGRDSKFDLQLLSQCSSKYNCPVRYASMLLGR